MGYKCRCCCDYGFVMRWKWQEKTLVVVDHNVPCPRCKRKDFWDYYKQKNLNLSDIEYPLIGNHAEYFSGYNHEKESILAILSKDESENGLS